MLFKNILNLHIDMKKLTSLLLVITLLSGLFISLLKKDSNASYSSKFANYPGYADLIKTLQAAHPNWEFEILETGLNWADVVKNESVARHGRSLIQKHDGIWNCSVCQNKQYEPGWYCASEATVSYYMDPRNSLNEDYIFQFEQLTYDEKIQTKAGVEKILADCKYMQGTIKYYDSNGKQQTINKTYIDVIMEAAKTYNVSPYHIASRIRQEQGVGSGGSMISGTWTGTDDAGNNYKGLYNYFNWGASGSNIMLAGMKKAKAMGWTDPEKAIKGGTQLLASSYISVGQDTLYLQKFDVTAQEGYYWHQYMTNIAAPKSESVSVRKAYLNLGLLSKDSKMKFKIPVYNNMPATKCSQPGMQSIVTQDVQINTNGVKIMKDKLTTSTVLATLNKGTNLVRIEKNNEKDANGDYWDKVVLSDGSKGYVQRKYLTDIALQSNINQKNIVVDYTNFRNGPGTQGTVVIKLLSPGQILTVIEKDKYKNLNGESWVRVKLSDGTVGYIGTGYTPQTPTIKVYEEKNETYDRIKVVCGDGLNIRSAPNASDNYNIIKTLRTGTVVTRTQKNASTNGGYIWDKVTTADGIVGYIVRQDKNSGKLWVEVVTNGMDEISGSGFQSTDKNLVCQPKITVNNIKKVATDAVIKKGNTTITGNTPVGTGYTITTGGKTYEIVVLGDTTGNGVIDSADLLAVRRHLLETVKLKNSYLSAADTTGNGTVDSADLLAIRRHLLETTSLEVK